MNMLKTLVKRYNNASLILRIVIGIVVGTVLALLVPGAAWIAAIGDLFVGALKAVAPVLVAVLVASSLCQGNARLDKRFGTVIFLYMLSTLLSALVAVLASFLFPQTLLLATEASGQGAPVGISEVLHNLLMSIVINPIHATANANYMGICFGLPCLAWP